MSIVLHCGVLVNRQLRKCDLGFLYCIFIEITLLFVPSNESVQAVEYRSYS